MCESRQTTVVGEQMFYKSTGVSNIYNFPGIWFPMKEVLVVNGQERIVKSGTKGVEHDWQVDILRKIGVPRDFLMRDFIARFDSLENLKRSIALGGWDECMPQCRTYKPTDEQTSRFVRPNHTEDMPDIAGHLKAIKAIFI